MKDVKRFFDIARIHGLLDLSKIARNRKLYIFSKLVGLIKWVVRELRTIKKKTVSKASAYVSIIILAAIFSFSSSVPTSTLIPEQIAPEPAINILNHQSYPSVGGNWTVAFNTTGQANLTVTPVNNTYFGIDIQFLELRCGDGVVNATPKYNGDSVFYADWNCSEIGYFGVKVLKAGKHTLEFRFGEDVEYAQNDAAGWYDTNWTYRKKITIDHTKVNGTQSNFPVLINLTSDMELAAKAQDDGDDILFTSSDGTNKLAHEIELYDSSTGKLIAWVNVTSLSNTPDTVLYMYYNNSTASNQQNPTGVWDTNYKGVWHLLGNSTALLPDATSNSNTGTKLAVGRPANTASGQIDGAQVFDGTNDYVNCGNDTSLDITDAITIEVWVKPMTNGWKYQNPITLSPATSQANYQVKIELTTSNFDYSKAKANGEDLRFYQTDGASLDYWIETWNTSGTSTIWVEVATSGTGTIYMYYSNPSASSASNGTNTFEFFDDFEDGNDNGWTEHNGNWYVVDNTYYQGADLTYMRTSNGDSSWGNYTIETKINISSGGSTGGFVGVLFRFQDTNNHYAVILDDRPDDSIWIRQWIGGGYSTHPQEWSDVTINRDTWYDLRVDVFDNAGVDTIRAHFNGITHEYNYTQYDNGKIALMMHGTQAYYDNIRVRKYTSPEPSASVGNETAAGISKAGAYGIGANTTTAFASINNQSISGVISSGWNHIALTYDKDAGGADEMKLYVDGIQKTTGDYSTVISTNTNNLWIGDLIAFNGTIDEGRVSATARSGDWINTSYNNQNDPSSFYIVEGEEDNIPPVITIDRPTEGSPVHKKGREQFYVNFTYTELNPKNYTVKIYNSSDVINSSFDEYPAGGENKLVNVSFNLNSTAADGWYNVSVEMYDNMSNYNISYQNNSVVKDEVEPSVISNTNNIWVANGSTVVLNATITDSLSGIKNSTVNVSLINSTINEAVLTKQAGTDYWINESIIADVGDTGGLKNLTITAYDNVSNCNNTVNITVGIDENAPSVTAITLNQWVANNTAVTFNASIIDTQSGVKNATVNVSKINSTINEAILEKQAGTDYWINTSTIADRGNTAELQNLTITAYDVSGNCNFSVNITVGVDGIPPPSITNLNEMANGTTWINWTWDNPTLPYTQPYSDFNHTMIYINGTGKMNVSNTTTYYNATGLTPNTTYNISTRTVDLVGNVNSTWVNDGAKTATDIIPTPPSPPRRPRGGRAAPRDSDGDGVSDVDEMLAGTDWKDPCDPNPDCAAYLTLRPPNPTPSPKPTPTPVVAPTLPPVVTPTPTPMPTPEEPGFEAVFAIAGLLAVAYLVLRRKK